MTAILGFLVLVFGAILCFMYFGLLMILAAIAVVIGIFAYLAGLSSPYNILLCVLYLFLLFGLARMIVSKK